MARKNSKKLVKRHPFEGATNCTSMWKDFCSRRSEWLCELDLTVPLYCLPVPAIESLLREFTTKLPIIAPAQAEAEHHLATVCMNSDAIGFWNGNPIQYPYLSRRSSATDAISLMAGYSESEIH